MSRGPLPGLAFLLLLFWGSTAGGSQLLVDTGVRASGHWCLPQADNPLRFRYLPKSVRLARDESGHPLFSWIRYLNSRSDGEDGTGSVLTFVLEYWTSQGQQSAIESSLRRIVGPDARLDGPVVFDKGSYALKSTVAGNNEADYSSGKAPVLEGGRVSFSLQFDHDETERLWAALQAATPDLSVVFDMTYSGVHSSFDAEVVVDWDKARHSLDRGLDASVSVYGVTVGGQIEQAVDRMRDDGSISILTRGEDAASEELIAHIQEIATKLFFEPLTTAEPPGDIDNALSQMATKNVAPQANQYFSLDLSVKYKRKDIASKGTTRIDIKKQGPASRHWSMIFDAGEIAAQLRDDPYFVKTVDLRQAVPERRIPVRVDAGINALFDDFVDLVTVELRKVHMGTSRETIDQVSLSPGKTGYNSPVVLRYPRVEGEYFNAWLDYSYRTTWRLKGDQAYTTDWVPSRDEEVIVYSPMRKAQFLPLGSMSALAERGVQAVIIEVRFPFFGREKTERFVSVTSNSKFEPFELLVPSEDIVFSYVVSHVSDTGRIQFTSSDTAGVVLIDPGG